MPNLKDHQSSQFTKLLLIGDSGSGKTGALTSLVGAGYKLRIWDFDNGLDPLVQHVRRTAVDKLGNIEYHTLRDRKKSSPIGPVIDGPPKAFITSLTAVRQVDRRFQARGMGKGLHRGHRQLDVYGRRRRGLGLHHNPRRLQRPRRPHGHIPSPESRRVRDRARHQRGVPLQRDRHRPHSLHRHARWQ
jgi:hypothetical protein